MPELSRFAGIVMYEVDDICYAGNPTDSIKVRSAKLCPGRMLLVEFCSGERRLFDLACLDGPAFAPLEDEANLRTMLVEHGFVSWMDGRIDVAPEYLYSRSLPYVEDVALLLAG